jgi:transcription initiation factor TFIIIB Brf1 subunit/transcription initiation factor TFIIB
LNHGEALFVINSTIGKQQRPHLTLRNQNLFDILLHNNVTKDLLNEATLVRMCPVNDEKSRSFLYSPNLTMATADTAVTVPVPIFDPEERRCRACHSPKPLFTDCAQGDRICTDCGVVDEGCLLDTTAEWREFNDADDLAKGGPALARCGLVRIDETKYVGGLQPTMLSKHCFGTSAPNVAHSRLVATNRRMDRRMEKLHARAITNVQLSNRLRLKRLANPIDDTDTDTVEPFNEGETIVRPELEQMILNEEEDASRARLALYADKWSLQRAIRLHNGESDCAAQVEERPERLDATLKRASSDLYSVYSMLLGAAKRLDLPDRVTQEATHMLCRYVTKRDGWHVRGVASTLRQKQPPDTTARSRSNVSRGVVERAAKEALSEYNKAKQMGALCAALLFFTARNMRWPRSLVEVCDSIKLPDAALSNSISNPHSLDTRKDAFIKRKHCSKAMTEIKEAFPDFAKSVASGDGVTTLKGHKEGDDASAIANFTEHTLRKLNLPPVAEASIHCLVLYYWQRLRKADNEKSDSDSKPARKLSVVCAAVAYFVCSAGSTMQRLAVQSSKRLEPSTKPAKRRKLDSLSVAVSESSEDKKEPLEKVTVVTDELGNVGSVRSDDDERLGLFDVSLDGWKDFAAEQRAYEMRRMWDAWSEQRPWDRSLVQVESCCGVSQKLLVEFYQEHLYSNRQNYLSVLQNAVRSDKTATSVEEKEDALFTLSETPLASILLTHVTAAAPLMKTAKNCRA